jgi:hypothetical protein
VVEPNEFVAVSL